MVIETEGCRELRLKRVINTKCGSQDVIRHIIVTDEGKCPMECLKEPSCVAASYIYNTQKCKLLSHCNGVTQMNGPTLFLNLDITEHADYAASLGD